MCSAKLSITLLENDFTKLHCTVLRVFILDLPCINQSLLSAPCDVIFLFLFYCMPL